MTRRDSTNFIELGTSFQNNGPVKLKYQDLLSCVGLIDLIFIIGVLLHTPFIACYSPLLKRESVALMMMLCFVTPLTVYP